MSQGSISALASALLALAAPPASPAAAPAAEIARPDTGEGAQWAAAVVRVDGLRQQTGLTAKLFGTAGGDPAMNGLYTWLAFFESPGDGWRVFRIGDFLGYRILSEAPGRLALEVRESVMDERTGAIRARTRRLLVSWTAGARGEPPAFLRVTAQR